ncbi:MAG: TlpA family protein disulfide reductase [Verrucomicrobiota bacterium JB025]|nr:TlpA disulfide reductase family protein [Verrucomicrobiota bacterium JB025]
MKHFHSKLALLAAGLTLPALALSPGDPVPIEAVSQAKFIQGKAPTGWNEDELYIFECWATWCGPCIAAIPHVDALYDSYHEKGLNVFGMNVFEDGEEKVAKFVGKKGDGMSYPVAYVGKGGAFETSWLKPAGVTGIPRALVVKNGKLLMTAHPASLDTATIEALLAGGEPQDAIVGKFNAASLKKSKSKAMTLAFTKATRAKDVPAMKDARAKLEEIDPESPYLERMALNITLTAADWAETENILNRIEDPKKAADTACFIAVQIDSITTGIPASLREKALALLDSGASDHSFELPAKARLQLALGHKELALASAREAAATNKRLPQPALDAFAASFETDAPQNLADFQKALRTEILKNRRQ